MKVSWRSGVTSSTEQSADPWESFRYRNNIRDQVASKSLNRARILQLKIFSKNKPEFGHHGQDQIKWNQVHFQKGLSCSDCRFSIDRRCLYDSLGGKFVSCGSGCIGGTTKDSSIFRSQMATTKAEILRQEFQTKHAGHSTLSSFSIRKSPPQLLSSKDRSTNWQ